MLDAKVGFNGNVNLNFNEKEKHSTGVNREEIYEQLYRPLLLINTCWIQHAKEINTLLEKMAKCIEFTKEPFYRMYNEINNYNANFVKYLSLGRISSKYKQSSAELVQCALFLENHFDDEKIDRDFIKNAIRIHEISNRILDMLRYDFGFQV